MKQEKTTNLTFYVAVYWLVFWLFNGADKFLNHSSFGPIVWYGKDRDWQFSVYLTNMQIPVEWVGSIIVFAGLVEIVIAAIFAIYLIRNFGDQQTNANANIYDFGLKASFITFVGFCAFDVVAGDRAELLEHSTYIGVVGVSYLIFYAESFLKSPALVDAPTSEVKSNSLKPAAKGVLVDHANSNDDDLDESDIIHTLRKYRKGE